MARVARKGDSISHGGEILTGSSNVTANGIKTARQGDAVRCKIHGIQAIASGSGSVFVNGKQRARVGDPITCGAVITGHSPDVDTGS